MDDKLSTQISTTARAAVVDDYNPPAPPREKGAFPLPLLRSYPLNAEALAAVVDDYNPPAPPREKGAFPLPLLCSYPLCRRFARYQTRVLRFREATSHPPKRTSPRKKNYGKHYDYSINNEQK
jgi:hypothetical protein